MRYLADDGKDFETERECLEYEQKVLKAKLAKEAEEKAKAEEAKAVYNKIQNDVDKLNELIDRYEQLSEKPLFFTRLNGHINITRPADIDPFNDPLRLLLSELRIR